MFGEPVTLLPGAVLDENDDPVQRAGGELVLYGVVEPGGSEEPAGRGRAGLVERMRVYVSDPPPQPISRYAEIRIRGGVYRIEGEPASWVDPDGSTLGGLVIEAARMEG